MALKSTFFKLINRITPKRDQVIVYGSFKAESNAIAMANALAAETNRKIYFVVSKKFNALLRPLINPKVIFISRAGFYFYYFALLSKYVYSTHNNTLMGSSKRQIHINIWHGLLYKNIGRLKGDPGCHADITVGTSALSQEMFSKAFGVSKESVFISGYPRNDTMLRAQKRKEEILSYLSPDLTGYNKIILWMPTYRNSPTEKNNRGRLAIKMHNPFQVDNFDVQKFSTLLKNQNTICLLKPHYFYNLRSEEMAQYGNIILIEDNWFLRQGITLYELLGCADLLISDYSSVMIDFILADRPILCFCKDLEEYRKIQGLYFEDYEAWLPSELIENQTRFFEVLKLILETNTDPYEAKRKKLKSLFFKYQDDKNAKRLIDFVFNQKNFWLPKVIAKEKFKKRKASHNK